MILPFPMVASCLAFCSLFSKVIAIVPKRPLPPIPEIIPSLFFGEKLPVSRSQHLEYQSHHLHTDTAHPLYALKLDLHKYLAKHVCAFLNGALHYGLDTVSDRSTIRFGVEADGTIVGYQMNDNGMMDISRQISSLLSTIEGPFSYDISWKPVRNIVRRTEDETAFVISVSVWPSIDRTRVYALKKSDGHAFWIRKDTTVILMSYNNIVDAFLATQ